jgi:ArsR family transcriptional regulator
MKNKNTPSPHTVMMQHAARAEAMLKQLANAQRLMILCQIVATEKTVSELQELVDLSQSSLSQHLAKLRVEGIVSSEKRGRNIYYRLANHEVQALLSTLYLIYCKE